jgi:hypothetical protein
MRRSWRSTLVALGALAIVSPALAQPKPAASKTAPPKAAPAPDSGNADLAFGAFQRGFYLTALAEASKRAQQNDPRAMTLLGEIYAQGLGVGRDDAKAAQWYKQAATLGDRDAMFALAMFNFEGRAGSRNREEAARLLASAPSSATLPPTTISACSICRASSSRRISNAPPNCSPPPPKPAIRKRSTRSPRCTKKAAACLRTPARPCA